MKLSVPGGRSFNLAAGVARHLSPVCRLAVASFGKVLLLTLSFKGVVQGLIAKIRRESPAKATNCKSPAGNHSTRQQPVAGGPSILTSTPCTMLLLLNKTAVRTAQRQQPVQMCSPGAPLPLVPDLALTSGLISMCPVCSGTS